MYFMLQNYYLMGFRNITTKSLWINSKNPDLSESIQELKK